MSFIPIRRMSLCAQSWKERRLLCESVFVAIDKWTLILKSGGKKSVSYETKASMSFIPISRMSLWCPVMKRKEIIMWISVSPTWRMTTLKNGMKKCFSYETKAS